MRADMQSRRWGALRTASFVYAFGTLVHTIDHFRRGEGSVSWETVEVGTVGTVFAAIAITLILVGYRYAPHAAAAVGIAHGIGIAAVHWLPTWSVLSDSFITNNGSVVSWIAVALEVGGALATGLIGASMVFSSKAPETAGAELAKV